MASSTSPIQICGEIIRPTVESHEVRALVELLYGLQVDEIKELNSYEDRNYHVKVKEKLGNKHIEELSNDGYNLKVLNSRDSRETQQSIDAQNELMSFLQQKGVCCPVVVPTVDNQKWTLQQFPQTSSENETNCKKYIVRLLTFVPGTILFEVEYTPGLISNCGSYLSELHQTMKKFHHPAISKRDSSVWSMNKCHLLLQYLYVVKNIDDKKLVEEIIAAFQKKVQPHCSKFTKGLIHGDFNEHNILVQPIPSSGGNKPHVFVSGILDFADMDESYYIYDVAIAIMYLMVETKQFDPMAVGGYFLAGYTANQSLLDVEWKSLKICIAVRFCVSLVMGLYNYSLDPGNEYLLVTHTTGWSLVRRLWSTPDKNIHELWKTVMTTL